MTELNEDYSICIHTVTDPFTFQVQYRVYLVLPSFICPFKLLCALLCYYRYLFSSMNRYIFAYIWASFISCTILVPVF